MSMVIQVIGSVTILAGFALAQWGVLNQKSTAYLLINAIGSGLLAVDAVIEQQWGFLLLEGCGRSSLSLVSSGKKHLAKSK